MQRFEIQARPEWKNLAIEYGYDFFETAHGADCWKEDCHYVFTLGQIEYLEYVTEHLHKMCLDLVKEVANSPKLMHRLKIPEFMHRHIKDSVGNMDNHLYGRFDFAFNGYDQPKLLEYNADTPTVLFETAVWQWRWLEDLIKSDDLAANTDQFNSVHEKLIERWKKIGQFKTLHFTCMSEFEEDRGTVRYLQDTAEQAGFETKFIELSDILEETWDITPAVVSHMDQERDTIFQAFKLYPWEWMVNDAFGKNIPHANTQWIEPAWKMILSNKGMMALLWERHPNHHNLLPTFFEDDPTSLQAFPDGFVKKPLLSREGSNITVVKDKNVVNIPAAGGYGSEGYIKQGIADIPKFDSSDGERFAVIGSWVVGDEPAGMIIRESSTLVTDNWSQLVPHSIKG